MPMAWAGQITAESANRNQTGYWDNWLLGQSTLMDLHPQDCPRICHQARSEYVRKTSRDIELSRSRPEATFLHDPSCMSLVRQLLGENR